MMQSYLSPRFDRRLASLARSFLAFALIGFSLALAIEQLSASWLTSFIGLNTLPSRDARGKLLLGAAAGVLGGLAVAVALYWPRRQRDGVARLALWTRLAAPLMLVGFVPGLLRTEAWTDTLTFVLVLSAFLLLLERLWRLHFEAYRDPGRTSWTRHWHPPAGRGRGPWVAPHPHHGGWRLPAALRRGWPTAVVVAVALVYIAYMAFYAVRNHHRFNTYTWDLGQLDNQFYNFLHGHPFRCTALIREGNWSELRNHAEATMFFLLPFYALRPSAETLLVLQVVLLGAAGIPLYRLAARRLSRATALVILGAYYLYAPLHGAQLFDIHFQPLAAAFLLAALDCFDARKMRWFAVFFVLAIGCREDISVGIAVFGLFLVLTGHRARAGVVIVAVSLTYFVLLRFVIMPSFGSWGFAEHYKQLFPEGERTFAGIVKTIITNPAFTFATLLTKEKLRYTLQILAPLVFLPLRRPHLAMSVLPGAYFTLLTTEYGATLDIGYQYSGYFIPYIFPAAVLALQSLGRPATTTTAATTTTTTMNVGVARRRAAVATLIVATIVTTTHWGAIPPRRSFHAAYGSVSFEPPTPQHQQWRRDIRDLMRLVPREAILAVTDREMPHVSNRIECWNFSVGFQGSDYVLYTTDHPIPSEREQFDAMVRGGYVRLAERPGLLLYKRPGAP